MPRAGRVYCFYLQQKQAPLPPKQHVSLVPWHWNDCSLMWLKRVIMSVWSYIHTWRSWIYSISHMVKPSESWDQTRVMSKQMMKAWKARAVVAEGTRDGFWNNIIQSVKQHKQNTMIEGWSLQSQILKDWMRTIFTANFNVIFTC